MTGFGLGVLRLAPKDFWAATPAEIAAAARGMAGPPAKPLTRGELAALIARFPDGGDQDG
nr:phage tail assembly chaperone [Methylopila sp. M107]